VDLEAAGLLAVLEQLVEDEALLLLAQEVQVLLLLADLAQKFAEDLLFLVHRKLDVAVLGVVHDVAVRVVPLPGGADAHLAQQGLEQLLRLLLREVLQLLEVVEAPLLLLSLVNNLLVGEESGRAGRLQLTPKEIWGNVKVTREGEGGVFAGPDLQVRTAASREVLGEAVLAPAPLLHPPEPVVKGRREARQVRTAQGGVGGAGLELLAQERIWLVAEGLTVKGLGRE